MGLGYVAADIGWTAFERLWLWKQPWFWLAVVVLGLFWLFYALFLR